MEKGKWLIPACATTIAPPAQKDGNIRVFVNGKWGYTLDKDPTVVTPEPQDPDEVKSVSARQFKLQLLSAGLLDQVEAWVASQSREVQIAFEYSGTFVKDSPMMKVGFQAMGFNDQQITEFFTAASSL
jgi:hypothetical protein